MHKVPNFLHTPKPLFSSPFLIFCSSFLSSFLYSFALFFFSFLPSFFSLYQKKRWQQLGVFYPFSRNHDSISSIDQNPWDFGPLHLEVTRRYINLKNSLHLFWYTLFERNAQSGEPVVKPLWFLYPYDPHTYSIDQQFLVGEQIMVAPALSQNQTTVRAYLPKDLWYDFYSGELAGNKGWNTVPAPLQTLPLFLRGGSILPLLKPSLTLTSTLKNPFQLLIALDENKGARGEVYLDDGVSLQVGNRFSVFSMQVTNIANRSVLSVRGLYLGYNPNNNLLSDVTIFGVSSPVSQVSLDSKTITSFKYDSQLHTLTVSNISSPFFSVPWNLSWN